MQIVSPLWLVETVPLEDWQRAIALAVLAMTQETVCAVGLAGACVCICWIWVADWAGAGAGISTAENATNDTHTNEDFTTRVPQHLREASYTRGQRNPRRP